jgi:hypothetical protein
MASFWDQDDIECVPLRDVISQSSIPSSMEYSLEKNDNPNPWIDVSDMNTRKSSRYRKSIVRLDPSITNKQGKSCNKNNKLVQVKKTNNKSSYKPTKMVDKYTKKLSTKKNTVSTKSRKASDKALSNKNTGVNIDGPVLNPTSPKNKVGELAVYGSSSNSLSDSDHEGVSSSFSEFLDVDSTSIINNNSSPVSSPKPKKSAAFNWDKWSDDGVTINFVRNILIENGLAYSRS